MELKYNAMLDDGGYDIIDMELEEYIPLKIIFNKDEEIVEYISYSKDKTFS